MSNFSVQRIEAGEFTSNSYVCSEKNGQFSFLIDPGLDFRPIEEYLGSHRIRPSAILCTHGHFDHIGSAEFFQTKYGVPTFIHSADLKLAKAANFLLMALGLKSRVKLPKFSLLEGERIAQQIGEHTVYYNRVPGHTPGSCIVEFSDFLFSGDSLYAKGIGLSNLPGEDPKLLRLSLRKFWGQANPTSHVFPGHGPSASLADIRLNNRALMVFLAEKAELTEVVQDELK